MSDQGYRNDQVVFHCGLQKTGSTHLQRNVFPHIQGGTFHVAGALPNVLDALVTQQKPILLSNENLSGRPHAGDYRNQRRRLLASLADLWPGSKLMLFLREPSSLVRSFYHQEIMKGGTLPFAAWLERVELAPALYFDEFIDDVKSMKWSDTLFLDQAELMTDPATTVATMERFIGCRFDGWTGAVARESNVSVERAGARALRVANRFMHTPRNPKGPLSRELMRAAMMAKVHPLAAIQRGPLRPLNKVGRPVISDAEMEELRTEYGKSWTTAKAHMKETRA